MGSFKAMLGSTVNTYSASVRDDLDEFCTFFYNEMDSRPGVVSVLTHNEEVCTADASVSCPARDAHIRKIFFALHVAGSCDDGADFLGHLCQTQVSVPAPRESVSWVCRPMLHN